jgi:signal transduction histidine kinase
MAATTPSTRPAEEALGSVSRRLAAASHDLQQPLQAMGLLIEALRKHDLPDDTAAIVDRLVEAHGATRALLMAMLDLSRLEAGHIRPDFSVMRADEILADLKATFRPIAADKGILLGFVPCSAEVRTDRTWIVRILGNLIANALAHSGSDRIVVGCRRRGASLRFEVWDAGEGIDPVQLDAALAGTGEGPGMGLAIAVAAAALLDHALEARTVAGRGSMFAVSVPLAPQTLNSD